MQTSLFGHCPPRVDARFAGLRRLDLGEGAWVEHFPEWLAGHQALYDRLLHEVAFQGYRRRMYDRVVDVPRLLGHPPASGPAGELLRTTAALLSARYGLPLTSVTLAHYRDGRDSVAMHGDKMGSLSGDTIVATLSLGHPRRFLLKPLRGGRSRAFTLGFGDLFVMGGTCQQTHLHGVPKVARAEGRICIMFRPEVPERDAASEARAREALLRAGAARARQVRSTSRGALPLHFGL
jgi:alkylated DNA repair dioxygenase AlkB